MRISAFVIAVMIPLAGGLPAGAQEAGAESGVNPNADVTAPQQAITLDELFTELRHQTRVAAANRVARQIWRKWTDSGSDTINLLMLWSGKAMEEKNYAVAEDLLNQVVTLAPDFAEGWNRRATLYFAQSNYGRSIADIERTLQLEPRHFGALAGLGMILDRTGKDRKALETWYRVLEIYPANRRAQEAVVKLEEKLAGEAS
ncbi:MAG: tetratricopeptide repeat protein [Salaquimonas sp.]|jgi:tetratricopeptide (TPR) repeat protein|nr:tetratricopeptide repeat protein [Salaquimonas sp.]